MRAHLLILKTLLIRRDLRNLLIKHAVQHHKCVPANNSSITNRYQFILNCVFPTRLCDSGRGGGVAVGISGRDVRR